MLAHPHYIVFRYAATKSVVISFQFFPGREARLESPAVFFIPAGTLFRSGVTLVTSAGIEAD